MKTNQYKELAKEVANGTADPATLKSALHEASKEHTELEAMRRRFGHLVGHSFVWITVKRNTKKTMLTWSGVEEDSKAQPSTNNMLHKINDAFVESCRTIPVND